MRPGVDDAHPDHVHQAVLAGLLSHLGVRDGDSREFKGARDSRFVIAPGSVLSRRPPKWLMAAELVETNQLWARRVAVVQPEWAERLGAHLVKRSFGEAVWDFRSARATTTENVTLYGLPIVSNRTIGVDRVNPELARQLFIDHALVAGDWETKHHFVAANERFVERVRLLEARVRRSDLLDDEALFEFYDERIGADVTSGRHFDRWWRDQRTATPTLLDLDPSVLASRRGITLADYPDTFRQSCSGAVCNEFPITYRYEPGTPLDGATITVPLTALNQLTVDGFDWLIPGYRPDLVSLLVRSLPKDVRRELIPINDTIDAVLPRLGAPEGRLADAVAEAVTAVSGVAVRSSDFDSSRLPSHLVMHVVVVDAAGTVIDAGDDVELIKARQAGRARAALAQTTRLAERRDIVRWDVGRLERVIEQRSASGQVVRAFPTLLDRGDSVSLRVVDNEGLQQRAMRGGVRRLLSMTAAPTTTKVERTLDNASKLAIAASGIALADLAADCIEASVDAVMSRYDLPWDDVAYGVIEREVRADVPGLAADALAVSADVLAAADRVRRRLGALTAPALEPTVGDARAHLERLVASGFVRRAGTSRLPDLHRYVRGIEYRLDHLAGDVPRDRRRIAEVRPIEREFASALADMERVPDAVRDVGWMLEELRMSVFAQPLGVEGSASIKRVRQEFERQAGRRL